MKRILSFSTIAFFIILLEGYSSFLYGGQVTLEVSTTTGVNKGSLETSFKITNRGNEKAHQITVLAQFNKKKQNIAIADTIGSGQTVESEKIYFAVPEELQGSYPVYITTTYQHSNGVDVSSASVAVVKLGAQGNKLLNIVAKKGANPGEVSLQLDTNATGINLVQLTSHVPADLGIEPRAQEVSLLDGQGQAKFLISNISGNPGSKYGIFFAAEYNIDGIHYLATAELTMPVEDALPAISDQVEKVKTWLLALFLSCIAVLLGIVILSSRARQWIFRVESVPHLLDILVLVAVEIFIFSKFDLPSLFTATTTTGGDTASHYYTLQYLYETLLPAGKISGWTMGNYAGFPILQFYFPLPFLIMCLLNLVMPLQVAFKLVTWFGTGLLPVCAYIMLRLIRCSFPGPGIGAVLMLPFLFNSANSMWGGNILSTLAGEFSYSLSMALSLVLIGSLYRGALEEKWVIRNGLLVFLVGFSHGYTLLFAEAMSLFILITPTGFTKRATYLFKVYALGFCLLAFWLVPLLAFTKYTTSYHLVWTIRSIKEIIPEILLPTVVAAILGSAILLVWGLSALKKNGFELLARLAYLWFGLVAAIVFFVAAPRIGVVDIRYVPYGQLMACLLAALSLGWLGNRLLNRRGLHIILLILVTAFTMHWTNGRIGAVKGWSKWNYDGFEGKKTWSVFEQINKVLEGDFQDPRVIFEHSQDHNMFGSSRAFESLPLFAGRATLEGLYMQASITAPFIFYIQSMVSHESSQPFPQYSYTTMDLERARDYLRLFNVRDLVVKSSAAKQAIRQIVEYAKVKTIGQHEIWELTSNQDRYVEPLQYKPVAYQGGDPWKQIAHQWFSRNNLRDIHLVFNEELIEKNDSPLDLTADSPDQLPRQTIDISGCNVKESIKDQEILLETNCSGKPHLIKVSYHPNWQVEGAEKIYLVTPSFMLIYPNKEKVRLFYGPGPWDRLGQVMTVIGIMVLLLNVPLPGRELGTLWSKISKQLGLPASLDLRFFPDPSPLARRIIMLTILLASFMLITTGSYRAYKNEPYRGYNQSIQYKDTGQYEKARTGFRNFMQAYPLANLAQESSYYIGISYYLEKKEKEAIKAFEEYVKRYPRGKRIAEVHYHIGLLLLRTGEKEEGVNRMRLVTDNYPGTPWAKYAQERLQKKGFSPQGKQIDINNSNLNHYMGRAITYFNQDKLDEAKPLLLQIITRFPGFAGAPQALAALALCYYKEGDYPNTIKYYQKLIERYPDHRLVPEAYFHLGLCFERLGNPDLAKDAFRKVVTLDMSGIYAKQAAKKINQYK
jgi:TolA-binding protein